jgi:peptidoglycan biosynthesis protein MviN/MurJ (putative lipid II flippase)
VHDLIWKEIPNHVGIAIALSISGWINTLVLAGWSYMKGYFKLNSVFIQSLIRITVIAGLLVGVSYIIYPWIYSLAFDATVMYRWISLCLIVIIAATAYFITDIYYKKLLGIKR